MKPMTTSSLCRAAAMVVALASPALAQTPPMTPDVPARFDAPLAGYDYVKRDVMIPMRDGVKLYTVIVVPKGAARAPIILTRTPYNAAGRADAHLVVAHAGDAAARATKSSSWTATSASSRTSAASTGPKATTS